MLDCRYKGQCHIEYDADFDVCYPCIGDCGDTCAEYEPMPDVDALLALADDMDSSRSRCDFCIKHGECDWADETMCLESMMDDYARCIRKALGVEDDQ